MTSWQGILDHRSGRLHRARSTAANRSVAPYRWLSLELLAAHPMDGQMDAPRHTSPSVA